MRKEDEMRKEDKMNTDDTLVLNWTDFYGKEQRREFRQLIDIRDFVGTPGYSMLVVGANTHLSACDLRRLLDAQARKTPGAARSLSWIKRRRWMFQRPGTVNRNGAKADRDGNTARALKLMADHSLLSTRSLAALLKRHGITRSSEWVRQHRCEGMAGGGAV